jgi:hypothetical protein
MRQIREWFKKKKKRKKEFKPFIFEEKPRENVMEARFKMLFVSKSKINN